MAYFRPNYKYYETRVSIYTLGTTRHYEEHAASVRPYQHRGNNGTGCEETALAASAEGPDISTSSTHLPRGSLFTFPFGASPFRSWGKRAFRNPVSLSIIITISK